MSQLLVPLVSSILGACIGSFVSWQFMRVATRSKARREVLIKVAEALEDYRAIYDSCSAGYMRAAMADQGSWVRKDYGETMPGDSDDRNRVNLERGRLRVLIALIYAQFPHEEEIVALCQGIYELLAISDSGPAFDCREVDGVAVKVFELVPDLIRRFS